MKPDLTNVKNIIFDLGNVLLNLDFNASINAFHNLGLDSKVLDKQQAYADPVFYELEVGQISPGNFRKRVREILKNPNATDQQIDEAWTAMLLDIPESRVNLVQELGKNFKVYLFSNTNQIHIEKLHPAFKKQYGSEFSSLFVKDFYSHKINERKPDLSSYLKVIKLAGIKPEETLFVDDHEKNIDGAQKAGLKTFWLKAGIELTDAFNSKII